MRAAETIHGFLKWLWPAVGGVAVAVVGIALAASQVWDGAKDWTADRYLGAVAIVGSPWAWVAMIAIFLAWLMAFIWSGVAAERMERAPTPASPPPSMPHLKTETPERIPLDVAFRRKHVSSGWAMLSEDRDRDSWALQYGPVLLTNLSKTDRLILEIELRVFGPDTADFRLPASDIEPGGRTYGATIRDRLLSAGIEPTVYFRSPFTIEPQTSVEVKLLFMTPAYGSDLMDKLLPRFAKQGGYNYSLIIKDRISGRSIDIPIADYHGA